MAAQDLFSAREALQKHPKIDEWREAATGRFARGLIRNRHCADV
jgi:hypothetical protein